MTSRHRESGQSLIELVVVVAIVGTLAGTAIPALNKAMSRAALRSAAGRVQLLLRLTQEEAMALNCKRGIRFAHVDNRWTWAVYADGDNDGVLNADIASGVDPIVAGPEDVGLFRGMASIGIPPEGVLHPDDGTWMTAEMSPVRFNASSICSFAPDGSSTPGSVYLSSTGGEAALVRSSGDGGRIRVMFYDRWAKKWVLL
ncbi:MAG TPA: GspH/FimT family pseudopilin [Thermoanaerobaculia bacterium]|jgi:type II secretory pathway pseudopilin PulG|nr:GspH/FimT family pseudopilin [Thermoanaerobaculia bacterium]